MKSLSLLITALLVSALIGHANASSAAPSFYCDMSALTPAERTRHFDVLGPALVAKRTVVRELANGYEFELPSDAETWQQLAEYLEGERRCCPFFDIDLRIAPHHGPLRVRFTGRPGVKQFIEADAPDWIKPVTAVKP